LGEKCIIHKFEKKDFNFTREPKVPFETLLPEGVILWGSFYVESRNNLIEE